jgi:hypothetical protein
MTANSLTILERNSIYFAVFGLEENNQNEEDSAISKLKAVLPTIIKEIGTQIQRSFWEHSLKKKYGASKKLMIIYKTSNKITLKIDAYINKVYKLFPTIEKSHVAKQILLNEGKYEDMQALVNLVKLHDFLHSNKNLTVGNLRDTKELSNVAKTVHYLNISCKEARIFKQTLKNDFDMPIQEYGFYDNLMDAKISSRSMQ